MLFRNSAVLPFVAGALLIASAAAAQQQMPPKQVGVIELHEQDVPRIVTLPGRAVAAEQAAIRPRVSGLVTEVLYRPGTQLKVGDPMFRIDATTYQANVTSAEANVASARAVASQARSAFERAQRLVGSGTTQAAVENALAAQEQAEAAIKSAEAALDIARAELDWTTITSPIDGMASISSVSVGDLVAASQTDAMATVTRLDPIEVDIFQPSSRILRVLDDIEAGRLKTNDTIQATLTLENGRTYEVSGSLYAPGFNVSTSTGAVDNRFRFQNPDSRLLPGMFVRGTIELGITHAILVSQSAATRDKTGRLTAWFIEDGKPVQRQLTEDGTYQNNWIVIDGVKEGDQLIVDGLMGLMAGMDVVTVPVEYDASGVVRKVPAAAPVDGAAPADPAAAPEAPATEQKSE
ncbi:MAG: efflux RND transporter periplasmic adaptor subunit [Cereibacter sphaeroides]|uniref:Efflux RND transporter periplasmic adaptor subunit n=1 Tax=Cereibacter sphaeroides TaxID=1063 RepID=A0A2W5SL89_CERSP|nr:MAG: efflux RND transporter periplasmic adaptor subunit [Cereibacter sphaeroides]